MVLDTTLVSRIQFAFTISFHILFPSFSIGMAMFLAIMEGVWLKTRNPRYLEICKFWMKIFALTFGMGIVSGIVMAFQLGTNWAGFTRRIGDVLGALFTYEVLTAFFIEAGFLGVMLFGWNRVGSKLHYLATLLVTFGTTFSAFWIMSANSWMQTPAGFHLVNGKYEVSSWWHVIFNPSVMPRYAHMIVAAYITTSFVIAGISAYYLIKKQHVEFSKKCFSFVMWAILILMPLQIYLGDTVGLEVHKNQPLKTAAMEGVWNTQKGAPFLVFALPDQNKEKNYFEIKIPHGAALINTHQWNGELIGLKSVGKNDIPFVPIVFFSFRIMVGLGLLMLLIALTAWWLRHKKVLFEKTWFLKTCVVTIPVGFIALWTGWITAEAGRQPWVVYNLIRTSEASSKVLLSNVLVSFVLIIIVYGIIFGFFYFYYLIKIIREGPAEGKPKLLDQSFQYMSSAATDKEDKE